MKKENKKFLILYTSHTLGHKSIAENIGYHLQAAGYEVRLEDILQVQKGRLVSWAESAHRFLTVQAPWLWSFFYTSDWFTALTLPYRTRLAAAHHAQTLALIQEYGPDVVITTQTTASAVVAYLKQNGLYNGAFGIAFSDFHLHRYWLYFQADFYLANTAEQKQDMVELGVDEAIIFVCGMLLGQELRVDREEVKRELGIAEDEKVVLVSNGSFGFGLDDGIIAAIQEIEHARVVVVCGRNQAAYEQMSRRFSGSTVVVLGFYAPMQKLYSIADVFITKPGGLSVAEALSYFLPMMVVYMLPGQEELNYSYLSEKGLIMPEPIELKDDIQEELSGASFRDMLRKNPACRDIAGKPEVLLRAVQGFLEKK